MATFSDGLGGTAGALLSARSGWAAIVAGGGLADGRISTAGDGVTMGQGAAADAIVIAPTSQPAGADQFASALLIASGTSYQLGIRVTLGGTAIFGGYFGRRTNTTAAGMTLVRRSTSALAATTYTTLGTGDGSNLTDPVYLCGRGNSIWIEQNGAIIVGPVTDTNFPAGAVGTHPRGATPSTSTNTTKTIDNWASGDLTATGYTLAAVVGSFALTGAAASLRVSRRLPAVVASFTVAPAAASLRISRRLSAAQAAFVMEGAAANLRVARKIPADPAHFSFVGSPAVLRVSRRLLAEPGTFAVAGNDAQLRVTHGSGPVPPDHILVVRARARTAVLDPRDRTAAAPARPRILTA